MRNIALTLLVVVYALAYLSCSAKDIRKSRESMSNRSYEERREDRKKVEEFNRSKEEKEENEKAIREFNEKVKEKVSSGDDVQ